jgi:hypothetical protein
MEGCFEKIISNVDVFRMLRFSVTDVFTLRLVSKRLNTVVTTQNYFWQTAFPPLKNKDEVVNMCQTRYIICKISDAIEWSSLMIKKRSRIIIHLDKRRGKISHFKCKILECDKNSETIEKEHRESQQLLKRESQQLLKKLKT